MARLHLLVGPVAAGKSTFALQLGQRHRGVHLNLDEWMARLFSPDRPDFGVMDWYVERTARCIEQIWRLTTNMIDVGTDVILEIGLLQRCDRERLYERVDARGYDLTVYVLDAPRELRRERVQQRNHEKGETFSMVVPPHIFELASDMWEPLDEDECSGRDVRFISTDSSMLDR
ncbi:AAA family ATPase [Archangium lipolyticum]|uniref:AAA family ATPase n=1 Tax=Archangium lipolyticum TaxID=2970465 RepID=UPI002149CC7E|nr:ATP-binding protein [Archangium lipolyticum]